MTEHQSESYKISRISGGFSVRYLWGNEWIDVDTAKDYDEAREIIKEHSSKLKEPDHA